MSTDGPVATLVHRGQGRTRLRIASKRGNKAFFERLVPQLAALPGVAQVEARPQTGSILFHHRVPWPEVAAAIGETGLFAIGGEAAEAVGPFASLALPSVPPQLMAAGGMAALAAMQFFRGQTLPPAVTLLWYANELTSRVFKTPNKE